MHLSWDELKNVFSATACLVASAGNVADNQLNTSTLMLCSQPCRRN